MARCQAAGRGNVAARSAGIPLQTSASISVLAAHAAFDSFSVMYESCNGGSSEGSLPLKAATRFERRVSMEYQLRRGTEVTTRWRHHIQE